MDTGTVRITDNDDPPTVTLALTPDMIAENGGVQHGDGDAGPSVEQGHEGDGDGGGGFAGRGGRLHAWRGAR